MMPLSALSSCLLRHHFASLGTKFTTVIKSGCLSIEAQSVSTRSFRSTKEHRNWRKVPRKFITGSITLNLWRCTWLIKEPFFLLPNSQLQNLSNKSHGIFRRQVLTESRYTLTRPSSKSSSSKYLHITRRTRTTPATVDQSKFLIPYCTRNSTSEQSNSLFSVPEEGPDEHEITLVIAISNQQHKKWTNPAQLFPCTLLQARITKTGNHMVDSNA